MRRGYVTFESREAYIRRIMRRDGITRKRALAVSFLLPDSEERLTLAIELKDGPVADLKADPNTAASVLQTLRSISAQEVLGITDADFVAQWQTDPALRAELIAKYALGARGSAVAANVTSRGVPGGPSLTFVQTDSAGRETRRTVSAAGVIMLATGGHGRAFAAQNATLAHETLHAVIGLMRATGVLTESDPAVKAAKALYGDPRQGVDELFNEERLADAMMRNAEYLGEAVEEAAFTDKKGRLTRPLRRRLGPIAQWIENLANAFLRNDLFSITPGALGPKQQTDDNAAAFHALTANAGAAARIWQANEQTRRDARAAAIMRRRAQLREERRHADKEHAMEEIRRLEAQDNILSDELAETQDANLSAKLHGIRSEIAALRSAFAAVRPNRDVKITPAVRRKWRSLNARIKTLQTREFNLMRERAALGRAPDARRDFLIAQERRAFGAEARQAAKALRAERARIAAIRLTDASTLANMIRREEDRLMADAIRDAKAAVAGRDARIAEIEALSDAGRLSVTATPPERADAMLTEARIEEQKQHVWKTYHDERGKQKRGYLRAPNGKQTSLTADQWLRAHTPAFLEDYGDWQAAALWRLADRAWNDPTAKETFKFRPSERLNAALEQLLGHAVEEFVISSDTARHIKAHHGDESHEKKRGQSAMTPEDVAVIPYIINSFDDAYRAPKNDKPNGEKSVEIMKRINGTSIVATIEAGPNRQIVVTTWKLVPTASMKSRRSDPPRPNVRNDIDTNTPNNVHEKCTIK